VGHAGPWSAGPAYRAGASQPPGIRSPAPNASREGTVSQ